MKISWKRTTRYGGSAVDGHDEAGRWVASLRYCGDGRISCAIAKNTHPRYDRVIVPIVVDATWRGSAFDGAKEFVEAWHRSRGL